MFDYNENLKLDYQELYFIDFHMSRGIILQYDCNCMDINLKMSSAWEEMTDMI